MINPISGIITGGLGLPAGQGLITNKFHLEVCTITVQVTEVGGSIPMRPGEIQNFYTPIGTKRSSGSDPMMRYDPSVPKNIVKIIINMKDKEYTREYLVPVERGKVIIKVVNFLNNIGSIVGSNLKKVSNKIKIIATNLRREK